MRILIISDSHGKNDDVKAVIEQVGPIDGLIHLGDIERGPEYIQSLVKCPTYMVAGNNDYDLVLPPEQIIEIEHYKILLTHGHRYYVNGGLEHLRQHAIASGVQIAMYGHTHVPHRETKDGLTILNPGSISYPRQEGRQRTFAIMEFDQNGNVFFSEGVLRSSLKDVYKNLF